MSGRMQRLCELCRKAEMRGRVVLTGHDHADVDSVISCLLMQRMLSSWGIASEIALPTGTDRQAERVLLGFGVDVSQLTGEIRPEDSVILMDHHRPLHGGSVIACIDHHPTDMPPDYPYIQIEQRGACALQVFDLMRESGMEIRREDEALAVAALWLDTVALRSAKISEEEAQWGRTRAKALQLDAPLLEREGLGLADMTLPTRELAMQQKKAFDFPAGRVCSTTIQTDAMTQERLSEILGVLRQAVREEGAVLWVYLVNDPIAMRSRRFDIAQDGCVREIRYDFLASRGKNVMPDVERMMAKMNDNTQEERHGWL